MSQEQPHKIIACLRADELICIQSKSNSLTERYVWERISLALDQFHSLPLGAYLTCVLVFKGDIDWFQKEVHSVRKVSPSFPLICLTEPSLQEKALSQLTGRWDILIPQFEGWEHALEKEIEKLAEIKEQQTAYKNGGCLLANEMSMKAYSHEILEHFLGKYDGNVYEVARRLEIGKSTIYRMLKEHAGQE